MEHEKKLAFIAKMTKMGLDHIQHMDSGGTIVASNPSAAPLAGSTSAVNTGADTNTGGVPINNLLGLTNHFQGASANITPGTNTSELNNAYTGATNGLTAQTGVVNETAPGLTQGLSTQGALSDELALQAAGLGPNPAQEALNRATGNNVKTTAAEISGTRGSSGNVGLMARQIGQQGAATQEGAVGEAATLQAQQQIAAQQERAALAAQQIGQGTGAVTTLNQENQNEQNILQGANTSANNAAVSMQGNINNVNAATAAANQNQSSNTVGGFLSGFGAASSIIPSLAKGGLVKAGGKDGYPMHDMAHAKYSLARVSQKGTAAEKKQIKAAIYKKYPTLAGKKMAEGGEVTDEPNFQPTPSDSSNGPSIGSPTALPANTTDFSKALASSKSSGGGGGGSLLSLAALFANGGEVKHGFMAARKMADGGYLAPTPLVVNNAAGPQSFTGQWVNSQVTPTSGPTIGSPISLPASGTNFSKGLSSSGKKAQPQKQSTKTADGTDLDPGSNLDATSGTLSGGTQFNDNAVDTGTDIPGSGSDAMLAAKGGGVKAKGTSEKATVKGDSLKNDKIPAMLSEGEVVMDRQTLQDPGPVGQMARAVAMHIEKRNKRKAA